MLGILPGRYFNWNVHALIVTLPWRTSLLEEDLSWGMVVECDVGSMGAISIIALGIDTK